MDIEEEDTEALIDLDCFEQLRQLWLNEAPMKYGVLAVMLLLNGVLWAVVYVTARADALLYLFGVLSSLVCLLLLARTLSQQTVWQHKLDQLSIKYPEDPRFWAMYQKPVLPELSWPLRLLGAAANNGVLLLMPLLFMLLWLLLWWRG